ncbi:polyhydroxyalkanoic acid system family protein [Arenimonas sp.]|uniref:polyhydroxyalkanoic acid system family protein n=1 Tax=Arenimonas sp. TaxID=1872635 RepID=UPI0039E52B6A
MSQIDIKRSHNLSQADARGKVEQIAKQLGRKFAMDHEWEGNTLHFSRSGVDGQIKVGAKQIHVVAQLGFLLMALKGPVEREIHRYLDEEFS